MTQASPTWPSQRQRHPPIDTTEGLATQGATRCPPRWVSVTVALARRAALGGMVLLAACTSTPPAPDWQSNAQGLLKSFQTAWLRGHSASAERDFARARAELASTGRLDWVARAELLRCATRSASLAHDACPAFAALRGDAVLADQAYADFLNADGAGLAAALLPAHHQALLGAASASAQTDRLSAMADPLARLVGAGVLLRMAAITPAEIAVATETASAQGWRRALLAWLGVQAQRAQADGQSDTLAHIQRRIELVQASAPGEN